MPDFTDVVTFNFVVSALLAVVGCVACYVLGRAEGRCHAAASYERGYDHGFHDAGGRA